VVWVLDLDGVVWLGPEPLPGAADAVARLRAAGERVLFATNNSFAELASQEAKLAGIGIPAEGDVVTSAMAAARMVEPGERALVCGGPGVVEALAARGADVLGRTAEGAGEVSDGPVDVLVVGFHRDFDFEGLRRAVGAVLRGARLLATNDDATYPTTAGPLPGGGALAAAVAYATGVEPEVAGKPHVAMAEVVRAQAGTSAGSHESVMVGDRPATDGRFARTLGYRFALVLTGVTSADDLPVDPEPDLVAPDLAHLVTSQLGT
jgi:HAD superfamily hydrolase (TIGR01450 family)